MAVKSLSWMDGDGQMVGLHKPKHSDQTAERNGHIDHIYIIAVRCKCRGKVAEMDQEIHCCNLINSSVHFDLKLRQQMWLNGVCVENNCVFVIT